MANIIKRRRHNPVKVGGIDFSLGIVASGFIAAYASRIIILFIPGFTKQTGGGLLGGGISPIIPPAIITAIPGYLLFTKQSDKTSWLIGSGIGYLWDAFIRHRISAV